MILYGKTKKKPLIVDNKIEVLVNPDKAIITFSDAAMKHFNISEGYIGISEDEDTIVAGIASKKLYMYITKEGEGFKVFKNGNVNSKFYTLLLQNAFNKGGDGMFKLDLSVTPTIIKDLEEISFFEFSKSIEGNVSKETTKEVAEFLESLPGNTSITQETIDTAMAILDQMPEVMESKVESQEPKILF